MASYLLLRIHLDMHGTSDMDDMKGANTIEVDT